MDTHLNTVLQNNRAIWKIASSLSIKYKHFAVISFGATGMILRSLYDNSTLQNCMTFIDNIDDCGLRAFHSLLSRTDVCFVIASISGETAESMVYVQRLIAAGSIDRLVIITNYTESPLVKVTLENPAITMIDMQNTCRFSFLHGATNFIATALGFDMDAFSVEVEYFGNISRNITAGQMLETSHYFVVPERLTSLMRWFCHIWGEYVVYAPVMSAAYSDVIHGRIELIKEHNVIPVVVNYSDNFICDELRDCVLVYSAQQRSVIKNVLGRYKNCAELNLASFSDAVAFFSPILREAYATSGRDKSKLNQLTVSCKKLMQVSLAGYPRE